MKVLEKKCRKDKDFKQQLVQMLEKIDNEETVKPQKKGFKEKMKKLAWWKKGKSKNTASSVAETPVVQVTKAECQTDQTTTSATEPDEDQEESEPIPWWKTVLACIIFFVAFGTCAVFAGLALLSFFPCL